MNKIIGIKSGAVLQRGKDGTCETYIYADCKSLQTTLGRIERVENRWRLTKIKIGGPYSFKIFTESYMFSLTDIYVGDLWLLGGQSNMEGVGFVTEKDEYYGTNKNEKIRAFYMEDEWRPAVPLLHRLWKSKDKYIADEWKNYRKNSPWNNYDKEDGEYPYEEYRGVGPGFAFALKMHEITGVPQGVIPCGIGGSSLNGWVPNTKKKNYYSSMIRRLKECGGNSRGLYWDQGEAECSFAGVEQYDRKMVELIESVRKTNSGELSVVFDQIAYNTLCNDSKDENICWSAIREKQRLLPDIIPDSDTVSTINSRLSDRIHKDSDSQYEIGNAAAMSMAHLCGYGGASSIKFKGFKVVHHKIIPYRYVVEIYYDNVIGKLKATGVPRGFTMQIGEGDYCFYPYKDIFDIKAEGEKVSFCSIHTYEQIMSAEIWYGIGNNCVCTITDEGGRYLPAMGPIRIKDYLLK